MSSSFVGGIAYAACTPNPAPTSTVTIRSQSGDFASATYLGVGQYRFAYVPGSEIDPNEACFSVCVRGLPAAPTIGKVLNLTDAGFDVELTTALGAVDTLFDVIIVQRPAN